PPRTVGRRLDTERLPSAVGRVGGDPHLSRLLESLRGLARRGAFEVLVEDESSLADGRVVLFRGVTERERCSGEDEDARQPRGLRRHGFLLLQRNPLAPPFITRGRAFCNDDEGRGGVGAICRASRPPCGTGRRPG